MCWILRVKINEIVLALEELSLHYSVMLQGPDHVPIENSHLYFFQFIEIIPFKHLPFEQHLRESTLILPTVG